MYSQEVQGLLRKARVINKNQALWQCEFEWDRSTYLVSVFQTKHSHSPNMSNCSSAYERKV